VSIAAGRGGETIWAEGFGFADLDRRMPVQPNHRFRIGTVSTALTSVAAGLLVERGRLKLDEPIQTYLADFPKKQWPVTLRQFMAHTSGLRSDGGDEGPLYGQHCEHPSDALRHFAAAPLRFEPGSKFQFSRYDWTVVSAAIEAAAGTSFLQFMQREVFEPLAMRDTVADSATKPHPEQASSYFPRLAGDPTWGIDEMRELHLSCYAGAMAFVSTPSDLVRFASGVNGGKLLRTSTVRLLQQPQRLLSGEETNYGLGWDLKTVTLRGRPTRTVGHDGDLLGGQTASLLTIPDQGIVVAVVSNISYADTSSLAVKIAEAFAGVDGSQ
jgi:CubicO group peptidase (beta-lactamase class C family)